MQGFDFHSNTRRNLTILGMMCAHCVMFCFASFVTTALLTFFVIFIQQSGNNVAWKQRILDVAAIIRINATSAKTETRLRFTSNLIQDLAVMSVFYTSYKPDYFEIIERGTVNTPLHKTSKSENDFTTGFIALGQNITNIVQLIRILYCGSKPYGTVGIWSTETDAWPAKYAYWDYI